MGLYVDYDADRWLFVPHTFPWSDFADEEQWADAVVDLFGGGPERTRPPAEMLDWLRAYLTGAARSNATGAVRLLHLPTLESPTLIVDIHEGPTDPAMPLDQLTGQNDERLTRPAEVAAFDSPHLGQGVRATRLRAHDDGSVIWATNWVWRRDGRDIVMLTGTTDLPVAEAMAPILDTLARSIRLP